MEDIEEEQQVAEPEQGTANFLTPRRRRRRKDIQSFEATSRLGRQTYSVLAV